MIDLRPMRLPDEGAPQYFARLAQTNGFEGAEAMATSMDLNWFLIADGTCVDWMEPPTSGSEEMLAASAVVDGRWVIINGVRIRRKQWSVQAITADLPSLLVGRSRQHTDTVSVCTKLAKNVLGHPVIVGLR